MAHQVPVGVQVGQPFSTGEECPVCRFDSIEAVVFIAMTRGMMVTLGFQWRCARRCVLPSPE